MKYKVKKFTESETGTLETDYGIVSKVFLDQILDGINYGDEIRVWEVNKCNHEVK